MTSFFLFGCNSNNETATNAINVDLVQYYREQIKAKLPYYQELKSNSKENDTFIFFTDPHCFNRDRDLKDELILLEQKFGLLKMCYDEFSPTFIMCGGDLLNDGYSKQQAICKLSAFNYVYNKTFKNPYFIVGNHDTNYQGDSYYENGDWKKCILSQEIINNIFFNGENSYYNFQTSSTSYYCFDSGIDWLSNKISDYQKEQIEWFAKSLLTDSKKYMVLFLHIPYVGEYKTFTAMLSSIGSILSSYNKRTVAIFDDKKYDYTNCNGYITFIQTGHKHEDISDKYLENVPIIITDSFLMNYSSIYHPFDVVFSDYTNNKTYCFRFGRGSNRTFNIIR